MAIGYLLASQFAGRVRPMLGYGLAELLAAVWAALVPTILDAIERYAPSMLVDHPSLTVRTTARSAIGFIALLPATMALGATLPFMAQGLVGERKSGSDRVAIAYAMNTLGALIGVVSATAFLLLVVGVRGSSYLGAGLSAGCGLIALSLRSPVPSRPPVDEIPQPAPLGIWLSIAVISGFGVLALEVLYTRMFALILHNSTYTFGIVVALCLLGLAIGSAALARTRIAPERMAGWAGMFGAAAIAGSTVLFARVTGLEYFRLGGSFVSYIAGVCLIVSAVVLPPIALLGILLPATWSAVEASDASKGRAVGRLTAANTVAAAVGSLATSFFLVPFLGLWTAFAAIACLFAVSSGVLLWKGKARIASMTLTPLVLLLIFASWHDRAKVTAARPGLDLLRTWNGPYGLLEVTKERSTGKLTIYQNLHYGLGSSKEAEGRELAQGHLPLLLHPDPKDVLFLGVGTGVTAASALSHPEVEHATAVELNPDVVEAARLYFRGPNRGVFDDPRMTVKIDDARHFLSRTNQKFDVIVSDLFIPWESRTGYLYTVEHYKAARKKLKPGGLFCQWIALYQVGETEFEAIADSLASVFPVTTLWWGQVDLDLSFVALIGSEQPLKFDEILLARRLSHLREKPEEAREYLLESPEKFLIHFNGQWSVRHPDRLNTDEHPIVEFLAPITQRDDRLLKRGILRSYVDRVLVKLPKSGLDRPRSR